MKNSIIKLALALVMLVIVVFAATSCQVKIGRDNFESARERTERLTAESQNEAAVCTCSEEELLAMPGARDAEGSDVCPNCGLPKNNDDTVVPEENAEQGTESASDIGNAEIPAE